MTASWVAMTAARLASIASSQSSSQSTKNASGASATPSRDNSSYNTTLRMHTTPVGRDAPDADGAIRGSTSALQSRCLGGVVPPSMASPRTDAPTASTAFQPRLTGTGLRIGVFDPYAHGLA